MLEAIPLNIADLYTKLNFPDDDDMHEARRIFHGRGHAYKNLNHITIDWLNPLLLITLFEPVATVDLIDLANKLKKAFIPCKSIQVQHRYKSDWPVDYILGKPIYQLTILENNINYKLEIKTGKNTGLFLDMRNGREWVQHNSKDKKVLNLFSYTCGFSVAAAEGSAKTIFNIDMSSPFLNIGRDNHRLNKHCLDTIRFEKLNIIKSFGRIKKYGPYDLIICDPPTYQKGSFNIVRDYPKIIRRCADFANKDAHFIFCINSPHIGRQTGKEFLIKSIEQYAPSLKLVDEIKPPDVFKENQNKGTKLLIFKNKIN